MSQSVRLSPAFVVESHKIEIKWALHETATHTRRAKERGVIRKVFQNTAACATVTSEHQASTLLGSWHGQLQYHAGVSGAVRTGTYK